MKLFSFALAACLVAALPAAAQNIASGSYIALRGPSGRWLAASDRGQVYLSTNPAPSGWEQWKYETAENGGFFLTSFHGTRLMVSPWGGPNQQTGVVTNEAVWKTDPPMLWWGLYAPGPGPIVQSACNGCQAYLYHSQIINHTTGLQSASILVDKGVAADTTVAAMLMAYDNKMAPLDPPNKAMLWTIVAVPSPAQPRRALQEAAMMTRGYNFQSLDGTYIAPAVYDAKQQTLNHGANRTWTPAVHTGDVSFNGRSIWENGPLLFGPGYNVFDGNRIRMVAGSSAGVTTPIVVTPAGIYDKWSFVDPSGYYKVGARVPANTPICIRHEGTGKLMSSVPSVPAVALSPNGCTTSGTWELWKIVNP